MSKNISTSSLNQLIYVHVQCQDPKKGQQKVPILKKKRALLYEMSTDKTSA